MDRTLLMRTFYNLNNAKEYQSHLKGKGIMTKIYAWYDEKLKLKSYTVDLPRKEV